MKYAFFPILILSTVACAPQFPRRVTYKISNRYSDTQRKLATYHYNSTRSFNLFQDGRTVSVNEPIKGQKSDFSITVWAPDIGTVPIYNSVLTKNGNGCCYQITEVLNRRTIFDSPRALTGNKLGGLTKTDQWVTKNLNVLFREVGEDKDAKPRQLTAKTLLIGDM
jgi:hypothetical protein